KLAIRLEDRQDVGLLRALAYPGAAAAGDLAPAPSLSGKAASTAKTPAAPESLSAGEHISLRIHHLRRSLQPELPPLFAPAVQLEALVVLGAAEQRLQLFVGRVLRQAFLQDFDGLLLLAALVLAPGVDRIEQGLALVAAHRALEDLLHLLVLLLTEEDRRQHRLRLPEAEQGARALAQVRLGLVELLLHVEQDADVGVQARGDS